MRILLFTMMMVCSLLTRAQDTLTKDGKLMIEFVDSAQGLTQDQIYGKVKAWFATYYGSGKEVIQTEDKESGKIIGNAIMETYFTKGVYKGSNTSNYVIDVTVRDGKYRVQLYDFMHAGRTKAETIASMVADTPKYHKDYDDYFTSLSIGAKVLRSDLAKVVRKVDDF